MRKIIRTLLAALLLTAASAATAASGVVIVDGDTIAVGHERIRILSIDTPETFHSRCENELMLGLKAKERLRELLDRGDIRIERDGQDRYRRTLAKVFVWTRDGQKIDVGETLIREGHALPYRPGAEAKLERLKVWCGSNATFDIGNVDRSEKHLAPRRIPTAAPRAICKWIITPTWGPSWCGNPTS